MTHKQKVLTLLLRLALGFLLLYTGYSKISDPSWTAAGYLNGAAMFTGFYQWLASPGMIGLTNFLNSYGQLFIGISLILGAFVRLSSVLGAIMMLLYYLALKFPYPNEHAFIVDDHIIYGLALLLIGALNAGQYWGLENWLKKSSLVKSVPALHKLVS